MVHFNDIHVLGGVSEGWVLLPGSEPFRSRPPHVLHLTNASCSLDI